MDKPSIIEQSILEPISPSVIETLFQSRSKFVSYLSRRLPSEAVAEDIFQKCLLSVIDNEDSLRDQQSLVPWFYRLLKNTLTDYYRSHASENRKHAQFLKELEVSGQTTAGPVDEVYKAICACLLDLLSTLKPAYAELIRRIDLEGELPGAVAKSLDVTPNNLLVRLHRARQALRKSLERSCGACSKHSCLDCSC